MLNHARQVACASLLAAMVAACGGSAGTTAPATASPESVAPASAPATANAEPVTLQYWTWFPPLETTQKMIAACEKAIPGIKVETTVLESTAYQDKMPLALSGGEAIDLVAVQTSTMVNQVNDNLTPLEPLLTQTVGADWASQVNPKAIEQSKILADDGQLYILPMGSLGSAVGYYNAEMLKKYGLEVPKTYADFKAFAEKLKAANPDILPAVFTGANWFQDEMVLTIIGQTKPNFFNDIRYGTGRWDDPAYVQALKDFKQMYDDGVFTKDLIDIDYSRSLETFYNGQAAILFQGTWEAGVLSESFRQEKGIKLADVGLMPVPVVHDGGTPSIRSFIELGMAVPKNSAHPAEAIKLLQCIVLGDGVDVWGPTFINLPSKLSYQVNPADLTSDAAREGYKTLVQLVANPSSDRNNVSAFSAVVGDGIIEVINGADPQAVATKLQQEWESGRYTK